MELFRLVLLLAHILGLAALIGGLLAQAGAGEKRVNAAMRDGVGTAFLSGLVLVGVLEAAGADVDRVKIGIKFSIGLVLLVLVMANTRKSQVPDGLFWGLLALAVANVAVAVLLSPAHTLPAT